MPIRTLVVHTVRRFSEATQRLSYLHNRSIKNIIGRAGRAGKETRGRVIFINDSEQEQIKQVLKNQGMESAYGALYRLVEAINSYITRKRINLNNDLIDRQTDPEFLSLIDSIDFTLLDLIPVDTHQSQIDNHIDELLERTLASRYCNTTQLRACLETVFKLRATKLQQSVAQNSWSILRKTGSSPRFWSFVTESRLLEHPYWLMLTNPTDGKWLKQVIIKLLDFSSLNSNIEPVTALKLIRGWMSGKTYAELSISTGFGIDDTLEALCSDIGYKIHDHAAKLCQLAIERHGEEVITETARNWSSLLQYGLGNMQQLDIFENGGTDRLAVWGMSRFFEENGVGLRGVDLITYIRINGRTIRAALERDVRVPQMSRNRLYREMRF